MRLLLKTAGRLLVVALLLVGVLVVTGKVRLQPVLTGSMVPAFPVGTLVAVTPVEADQLAVGDVIMFMPPKPYTTPTGGPVLHRIVTMEAGPKGERLLRTKGDANDGIDPWTIDADAGGLSTLRGSSLAAGRIVTMVRASSSGPALLLWPGLVLLWLLMRRPPRAGTPRYQPRHAL